MKRPYLYKTYLLVSVSLISSGALLAQGSDRSVPSPTSNIINVPPSEPVINVQPAIPKVEVIIPAAPGPNWLQILLTAFTGPITAGIGAWLGYLGAMKSIERKSQVDFAAEKRRIAADRHRVRATHLGELLGTMHVYRVVAFQAWLANRKQLSFRSENVTTLSNGQGPQIDPVLVRQAEEDYYGQEKLVLSTLAEVTGACEKFGRLPIEVDKDESSLSFAIEDWTEKLFKRIKETKHDFQSPSDFDTSGLMSQIRVLQEYMLELEQSGLEDRSPVPFEQHDPAGPLVKRSNIGLVPDKLL